MSYYVEVHSSAWHVENTQYILIIIIVISLLIHSFNSCLLSA